MSWIEIALIGGGSGVDFLHLQTRCTIHSYFLQHFEVDNGWTIPVLSLSPTTSHEHSIGFANFSMNIAQLCNSRQLAFSLVFASQSRSRHFFQKDQPNNNNRLSTDMWWKLANSKLKRTASYGISILQQLSTKWLTDYYVQINHIFSLAWLHLSRIQKQTDARSFCAIPSFRKSNML